MNRNHLIIIMMAMMINITADAAPKANIIATIVDADTELIIPAARVSIGFTYESGWAKRTSDKQIGLSDSNGMFTGSGATRKDTMIVAKKSGYYDSWYSTLDSGLTLNKPLNRWEPWPCEVTVKLKKIKDPVPMLVKSVRTSIPEKNKFFGFDLEVGDWVIPHGKGKVEDFIFKIKEGKESGDIKLDTFDISFSNEFDGIQEFKKVKENQSTFIWPFVALIDSYNNSHQFYREWHKTERYGYQFQGNNMDDKLYIFRVRTKNDSQGNIVSAKYGVMTSLGFSIYKDKFRNFKLTYKLNPDKNSRSLEFNGVNLFKDRDKQGRAK